MSRLEEITKLQLELGQTVSAMQPRGEKIMALRAEADSLDAENKAEEAKAIQLVMRIAALKKQLPQEAPER